jgi:hypothetical protein
MVTSGSCGFQVAQVLVSLLELCLEELPSLKGQVWLVPFYAHRVGPSRDGVVVVGHA